MNIRARVRTVVEDIIAYTCLSTPQERAYISDLVRFHLCRSRCRRGITVCCCTAGTCPGSGSSLTTGGSRFCRLLAIDGSDHIIILATGLEELLVACLIELHVVGRQVRVAIDETGVGVPGPVLEVCVSGRWANLPARHQSAPRW